MADFEIEQQSSLKTRIILVSILISVALVMIYVINNALTHLRSEVPDVLILLMGYFAVLFLLFSAWATLISAKKVIVTYDKINFLTRTLIGSWRRRVINLDEIQSVFLRKELQHILSGTVLVPITLDVLIFQNRSGKEYKIFSDFWRDKQTLKQLAEEIKKRKSSIKFDL